MNKDTIISVKNRSAGHVVYKLPEDGIRRDFAPGETRKIPYGELEKLTYQPGGKTLIAGYLQLEKPEVTDELDIHTEPEYWLSEAQIREMLLKTDNQDEFLDALDFAPPGVIDLIKDIAVEIRLNDYNKRKALLDKTGFDVSAALQHIDEERADSETEEAPKAQRRVQPKTETTTSTIRRTAPTTD